jgi:hypothetical protein
MSKWIRPLCSPRRSTTFEAAAKTQSTRPRGEHMAGKENSTIIRIESTVLVDFPDSMTARSGTTVIEIRDLCHITCRSLPESDTCVSKHETATRHSCRDVNNADRRSTRSHPARKYIASTCRRWRHSPQRQRGDIYFRTANLVRLPWRDRDRPRSSREMKSYEMLRNADENSQGGRTENSWSLRGVVEL